MVTTTLLNLESWDLLALTMSPAMRTSEPFFVCRANIVKVHLEWMFYTNSIKRKMLESRNMLTGHVRRVWKCIYLELVWQLWAVVFIMTWVRPRSFYNAIFLFVIGGFNRLKCFDRTTAQKTKICKTGKKRNCHIWDLKQKMFVISSWKIIERLIKSKIVRDELNNWSNYGPHTRTI